MQSLDQTVGLFTKPLTVKDLFTCRYCHTPPFLGRSACGKRKGKGDGAKLRKRATGSPTVGCGLS